MNEYFILDEHGNEVAVDLLTWAAWYQDSADRQIAATVLFGEVSISTVFLGTDHGHGGERLLYETMIFGGRLDSSQFRYGTRSEALAGHEKAVSSARNAKPL